VIEEQVLQFEGHARQVPEPSKNPELQLVHAIVDPDLKQAAQLAMVHLTH
jgi:hypothetical protein